MNTVGRIGSYISRGVYTVSGPFHPFGGAVDIIVVQQPDGSFRSSPWYVRFGKFQGVLKTREKVVSISVDGVDAGFHMYLDHKGEAYFLREVDGGEEDGELNLYPSSSGDELPDEKSQSAEKNRRLMKSVSSNFDAKVMGSSDSGEGKILARTNSRRSRIIGLVFGRRSMKEEIFKAEEEGLGPSAGRVDSLERAEIAANLLEVKWSTSLATRKYRKGNNSRLLNHDESMQRDSSNVSCSQKMGEGIESQAQKDVESPVEDAAAELSSSKEGVLGIKETSEFTSETVTHYEDYCVDHVGGEVKAKAVNVVSEIAADYNEEFDEAYLEDTTIDLPRHQSWEESLVQGVRSQELGESLRSLHSGLSAAAEEYHETMDFATEGDAGEAMEGGAMEVHAETMLVQTEAVSKDPAVIESEKSYKESPEVILLDPSEDGPNEVCDDWITGDGSRGELQLKLQSISSMDNSFSDGDFLKLASSPSSDSSEEVQFQFSDLSDPRIRKNSTVNRHLQDPVNDEEENACLENSTQERGAVDFDVAIGKLASSPINIARISHALVDEEIGRLAESMPTMRSHIEDIESYSLHFPLSQSLDIDSKPLNLLTLDIDSKPLNLLTPDKVVESLVEPEELLQQDQVNSSGNEQILQDGGNAPLSPEVELSLCRHLLYEGMGAEAATQAFESKKLDRDRFMSLCPMFMKDDRLVVRIRGHYFPWEAAAPIVLGLVTLGSKLVTETKGMIVVEKKAERMLEETSRAMSPSSVSWRLWPFSFKRSRSGKVMQDIGTEPSADEKERSLDIFKYSDKTALKPKLVKKMVRSTTPTSEQLASLNLKEGSNPVTFTFSTAMLGKQRVDARIYLWKWNTRIIISDVDGTITKSDVLGQFMPLVGMDWSQTGVAHLFSAIKENGYQLLFLSARAISQAYHTRQFLFNLKQDGKGLPDGPVVISPDGLFPSLYREVIRRAPHEFKIGCLEEIKALFPPDCNPFYAGFGNRDTDEISYLKVGIPKGKIFTINPRGEVVVNRHINTKSYMSLHTLVHGMFPPTAKSEQEDFNSWNYWKLPPPDIDI